MIRQVWNDILKAMMDPKAGFREVPHTADWELRVWAPDLPALLEQAALGMYALMGVCSEPGPELPHRVAMDFDDRENLLVAFLQELLFLIEVERLAARAFNLQVEGDRLRGDLSVAPVQSITKEIKAVTYHNLAIQKTDHGLETNIVFDI